MSAKNNRAVWGVLLLVFSFFVLLTFFAAYTLKQFNEDDGILSTVQNKEAEIAVVEVEGAIYSSAKTIEKLHKAEKDKTIKAIILRINSPGGAVGPTQEIYEEIVRIDKEKPIYASFESVAASGGYYLGAATRKIFTNAGAITGSIGVIMQFMDLSKLYEFAKLNPQPMKAGKYKDIGSPHRPLNDEEKALLSSTMAVVHKQFKDDILKRRKEKIKGDLEELAQGQIFSGEEAVKLGLADELAGLWEAGRKIHAELGLKSDFDLRFIKVKKNPYGLDFLEDAEELFQGVKLRALFDQSYLLMFK